MFRIETLHLVGIVLLAAAVCAMTEGDYDPAFTLAACGAIVGAATLGILLTDPDEDED